MAPVRKQCGKNAGSRILSCTISKQGWRQQQHNRVRGLMSPYPNFPATIMGLLEPAPAILLGQVWAARWNGGLLRRGVRIWPISLGPVPPLSQARVTLHLSSSAPICPPQPSVQSTLGRCKLIFPGRQGVWIWPPCAQPIPEERQMCLTTCLQTPWPA